MDTYIDIIGGEYSDYKTAFSLLYNMYCKYSILLTSKIENLIIQHRRDHILRFYVQELKIIKY